MTDPRLRAAVDKIRTTDLGRHIWDDIEGRPAQYEIVAENGRFQPAFDRAERKIRISPNTNPRLGVETREGCIQATIERQLAHELGHAYRHPDFNPDREIIVRRDFENALVSQFGEPPRTQPGLCDPTEPPETFWERIRRILRGG